MEIRPSSLPMVAQCPQFRSGESGKYAEAGTKRHEVLRRYCTGDKAALLDLDEDDRPAIEWAADVIEVHAPEGRERLWETKRTWTGANFEARHGTPDMTCGSHLFDFKWRMRDYTAQLADYSLALLQAGHESVTVHILYGEPQRHKTYVIDLPGAIATLEPIFAAVAENKPAAPCDYCSWCSRQIGCPAKLARVNALSKGRDDWQLEQYHASKIETADEMGKALRMARQVADWCESVEYHAREMALKKGVVPTGYKVQSRQGKRVITSVDTAFARAGLPQDKFLASCSVSLKSLVEQSMAVTGIGKAPAERNMEAKLGDIVQRQKPSISLVEMKESQ